MADKIHTFEMLRLDRKPTRPAAQWVRKMRPGTHGVALWNIGQRADELQIQSTAKATTIRAAMQLYLQYTQLTLLPRSIRIIFADYEEPNTLYRVLSVEPVSGEVKALLRGHVAGQAQNWQGWLVCNWTVQPVHRNPP